MTNEPGYVLIAIRSGYKSSHAYGRFAAEALESAQARIKRNDPDIVRFEIEAAQEFQQRNDNLSRKDRGRLDFFHDDWGHPVNVLSWPLRGEEVAA